MRHSINPVRRERALRRTLRSSLKAWAKFVLAPQGRLPATHHLVLMSALEALERGETERLMLLLPPGSAKSTYASLLFPAWWMARNPAGAVITACHTASLAQHFGRGVRSLVTEHAARLNLAIRSDARAAGRFLTQQGGEYYAVGVNGAVTGRRADLALIDDPVRSFADAESATARERIWNWYRSELITRLRPGGRVVVVMTRWHRDDLAGRLMQQGDWQVVRMPALAELDDAMGRAPGAALWPAWETREALLAKQATIGERAFAALFQQAPAASDGMIFDITKLKMTEMVPPGDTVRAWDLAATANVAGDPDWTVGVKLVRDNTGGFWVDDVRRLRASATDVANVICTTAQQDGQAVVVSLPRDPGQAGHFQASALTRQLAGFRVDCSAELGSKTHRALAVAAQVNGETVTLRRAGWNTAFIEELAAFPDGRKDDQVDALSRAFNRLATCGQQARFAVLPHLSR